MSELKPCPFCGKQAHMMVGNVECIYCGATMLEINSDSKASDNWNTRPLEDALSAENAKLREALKSARDVILDVENYDPVPYFRVEETLTLSKEALK